MLLIFAAGSADRTYVFFGASYTDQIWLYRVVVWVAPVLVFLLVRRICRELQQADRVREIREQAEAEAKARDRAAVAPRQEAPGGLR